MVAKWMPSLLLSISNLLLPVSFAVVHVSNTPLELLLAVKDSQVTGSTEGTTVRLAFEISKKILSDAIIRIRPLVVAVLGTCTVSLPSLGVLAASITGKLWPPSVENPIVTLLHFIRALVVFATFQVMVTRLPPFHLIALSSPVTTKGPAVLST